MHKRFTWRTDHEVLVMAQFIFFDAFIMISWQHTWHRSEITIARIVGVFVLCLNIVHESEVSWCGHVKFSVLCANVCWARATYWAVGRPC